MKFKNILFSFVLLGMLPIAAADGADAVVVQMGQQQQQDPAAQFLAELQAVQASGVELAARTGFARMMPYASYVADVIKCGVMGVGVGALALFRFGKISEDRQITLPVILISGGVGAAAGVYLSERKRRNLARRAEQERQRLQTEANSEAQLREAAQRLAGAAGREELLVQARQDLERERNTARDDLNAANERNNALIAQIGHLTNATRDGLDGVRQALGVGQGVNLQALAAIHRANLAGQQALLGLQLLNHEGDTTTPAVVNARQTLTRVELGLEQLDTVTAAMQIAEGQQLALPQPPQQQQNNDN